MESNFKLIEGKFSVQEAREVILHLLEFKMQYHSKQNFSSEIRTGVKDVHSLARIENLMATKQAFLEQLNALSPDDSVSIFSEIHIKT